MPAHGGWYLAFTNRATLQPNGAESCPRCAVLVLVPTGADPDLLPVSLEAISDAQCRLRFMRDPIKAVQRCNAPGWSVVDQASILSPKEHMAGNVKIGAASIYKCSSPLRAGAGEVFRVEYDTAHACLNEGSNMFDRRETEDISRRSLHESDCPKKS